MAGDQTKPVGFNIDIGDLLREATKPKRRRRTTASSSTSMDAAVRRAVRAELADVEKALRDLSEEVAKLRRANTELAAKVGRLTRD